MFMRRSNRAARTLGGTEGDGVDRRRLMRLGGAAAIGAAGAAVIGLGDAAPAGATPSKPRSGIVSMTGPRQTVAVPGGLTQRSHVLATVNSDPDQLGYFPVISATPDRAAGTITLRLNSFAPMAPLPEVAWLVVDEA